ncbi:MAG: DNA polymerase II [Acidobacteriota bacterium]
MADRGFILQPSYRLVHGRPVVMLHGVLDTGESFLVRDGRETPSFFVRAVDHERVIELASGLDPRIAESLRIEASDWTTFHGDEAARVTFTRPPDAVPIRDHLRAHGVVCFEADVRYATLFLARRGLRGTITIEGEWTRGKGPARGVDRVYDDPTLSPADWTPRLTVLSIDIETDPRAERLLSIGLFGPGVAEVLLHCPDDLEAPAGSVRLLRERDLLTTLVRRVRQIDPDVITGWNVVDFDFRVLDRLARQHRVRLELGRGPGTLRLRPSNSPFSSLDASVPGRQILDGLELLRGAYVKMDSFSLGAVAKAILGEGKLIEGDDRGGAILDAFYNDRQKLVDYNLADARLVVDILDELHLLDLAVERSRLTGLPVDRVAGAIAALDSLYLAELSKRRIAAPSVGSGAHGAADDDPTVNLGGAVLEPDPGLWHNVFVFDFKSLYPSLMRSFQIDPLGYVDAPGPDDDLIRAPNGAAFRREPGILPGLLDVLFPRREAAKAAGDKTASHAIKILMNSFYGVLGTRACRFHRPAIAGAITAFGRELLLWTKARCEEHGFRVLYGDTDSLFVLSGETDTVAARSRGEALVEQLDADVAEHLRTTWRVESRLELEFEKLYRRLLLQETRGSSSTSRSARGARKRYAGLLDTEDPEGEVELTGLEAVRRDWTDLAKTVQRELYDRLFHDADVEAYLHDVVAALRAGEHDEQLVYVKALRKRLDEYTATTPPHVAAARKMAKPPRRLVRYVLTRGGPEPADERKHRLDHEHYVQKQIRPVAEPVLQVLDLDFDRVIGDDAQMTLF